MVYAFHLLANLFENDGSGFIDELAWLFVPPPSGQDYWGIDWVSYRSTAAANQISHYPTYDSASCFSQLVCPPEKCHRLRWFPKMASIRHMALEVLLRQSMTGSL
jgi:hypothetical protein